MELIFTNDFSLENTFEKEKYITKLENSILKYNKSLLEGFSYVDDATYTNCIELLNMLAPESPLLENEKHVYFIKSLNEETVDFLQKKVEGLEQLRFYLNPQGLNVRLVYEYGELVEAITFGRSFKDMDVLELMTEIMTSRNDFLDDVEKVEVEGTLVLSLDNIEMAQEYCTVHNAYQGVFAFINYLLELDDDLDENLEEVAYFIATDIYSEDIPFGNIESKYDYLLEHGFEIPELMEFVRESNLSYDLESVLDIAETQQLNYGYLTDGFRLLTTDNDIILFKIGSWEIFYSEAQIKEIEWVDSKGKKLPILKFEKPIQIMENVYLKDYMISEIVLNNINLLLILDVQIGGFVRFAYFGDMGVLPITKNNEIILN